MNSEENVWYEARNEDGSCRINLDNSYLKIYLSVDEVKEALDRHIQEYHSEGATYIICKTTYTTTRNEAGRFVEARTVVEAVEAYCKEGLA